MNILRLSLFLVFSITLIILLAEVQEANSYYAYAVKGIVKDVRLHPTKFIGGWFFKKAFILKKLKLKWIIKKKLILKKLLKKLLLIGVGVAKLKGKGGGIRIFAPKIILPVVPRYFSSGWGPLNYWSHAPIDYFRRRKRAVRFPEENSQQSHFPESISSHSFRGDDNNNDYFQRYNIGSLGLSQTDLEQLRRLPENLKTEYGHEMEQLEAAASEPKEEEIQDYLSTASEFDQDGCIPKSICEIMARGNHTANQFENQIIDYYREAGTNSEKITGSPDYAYDYAAYLGKTSRDPRMCANHFRTCNDSQQALNSFMNEVFTPEMCDTSSIFSERNRDRHQYLI